MKNILPPPAAHDQLFLILNCFSCSAVSHDRRAKRHQRKFCDLKALQAKGNTDDRYTKQQAVYRRSHCQRNPADDQPHNIRQQRYGPAAILYVLPKRKERHGSKLKTLSPDRNPDDRYTPQQAGKCP